MLIIRQLDTKCLNKFSFSLLIIILQNNEINNNSYIHIKSWNEIPKIQILKQIQFKNQQTSDLIQLTSFQKLYLNLINNQTTMNSLAFNPNCQQIEEWKDLYLNQKTIDAFEQIIDKAYMYLEVIDSNKNKALNDARNIDEIDPQSLSRMQNLSSSKLRMTVLSEQNQDIQQGIQRIKQFKSKFLDEYNESIKRYVQNQKDSKLRKAGELDHSKILKNVLNKVQFNSKMTICEDHLEELKGLTITNYHNYLLEQINLIENFMRYKLGQITIKFGKLNQYLTLIPVLQSPELRIIYDNIYIETEYLKNLIDKNIKIIEENLLQKEFSSEGRQIHQMKDIHLSKLKELLNQTEDLKQQLRQAYFIHFKKRGAKRIKDHLKLQKIISNEISINKAEYSKSQSSTYFVIGLIFGILIVILALIIAVRQLNFQSLSQSDSYLTRFRIWRGASYFIYFNWVIAIVVFLWTKMRINYRMILTDDDTFLPKYQQFFLSATILSAIYLILFSVSLIGQLGIIDSPSVLNMGFYMWIINIVYLFNPFKICNYEGRRYFIKLFIKVLISPFRPMSLNLLFLSMIIASFIQPFSDFAFTVCQAVYLQQRNCERQTLLATYIFNQVFLIYRFVQSIRLYMQMGRGKIFSRPIFALSAVIFTTNTVIASFVYNLYLTKQLQIYWIVSSSISCLVGANADLRADWGFFSYDKEDWILRKYKKYPRKVYFIVAFLDIILNIWLALTISNNLATNIGMNPIYYLMILAYVQLARKGMWMFFRVEDDHCTNVGNLAAVLDDSHFYTEVEARLKQTKNADQKYKIQSKHNIIENVWTMKQQKSHPKLIQKQLFQKLIVSRQREESEINLEYIQQMIVIKNSHSKSVQLLLSQLQSYLKVIHSIYQNLNWEDSY